jgi:hypothetical protein
MISDVKDQMLKTYKIDLNKIKPFGPRSKDGYFVEHSNAIRDDGVDADFFDEHILRFCQGRKWKIDQVCKSLIYHFEWR